MKMSQDSKTDQESYNKSRTVDRKTDQRFKEHARVKKEVHQLTRTNEASL